MTAFNGYFKPRHGKRNGMKTSEIGAVKKDRVQWERYYATQLEGLFDVHLLDYIHVERSDKANKSFPDYNVFGKGWSAYVELKARNPFTRKAGRLDDGQRAFHEVLKRAGCEVVTWLFPDDELIAQAWLTSKTGRKASSWGLKLPEIEAQI